MKNKEITVSWVASKFEVSTDMVKKWVKLFGEYLSVEATVSGKARQFTLNDMAILAVINDHHDWQDDDGDYSDVYSAITEGLSTDTHYQLQAHLNFPVFQEIPEGLNEDWTHGALVGVMGQSDRLWIAQSFKMAADVLVDASIKNEIAYKTIYPILYNYRHALELYLKEISGSEEWTHNLNSLLEKLKAKYGMEISRWAKDFITELHAIDNESMAFRYGNLTSIIDEKWVNLLQLKNLVGILCNEIEKYLIQR